MTLAADGESAGERAPAIGAAALGVPVALIAASPGLVYAAGFDHLAYLLGIMAGLVLAGVWIAPKLAALEASSLTDALQTRFGAMTARLAAIVIVLALLPVLVAEFTTASALLDSALGLPVRAGLALLCALAVIGALLLDARAMVLLAKLSFAALVLSLAVPLVALSVKHSGLPVLAFGYGPSLPGIGAFEDTILQSGNVDFDTFGAHTATFLKLSPFDFSGLAFSLATGLAVLAPLLGVPANSGASASRVRLAGAWTALLAIFVLGSVPALAAYAKLDIYETLAQPAPLNALPAWVEAPSRAGRAHIHGTSAALLGAVKDAVDAGHADTPAVADHLAGRSQALEVRWTSLDDAVKAALIDAARALQGAASPAALWEAYTGRVLPAAAIATGTPDPVLTQSALVIEPLGLFMALPALAGLPDSVATAIMLAVALAALMMSAALLNAILTPGPARGDASPSSLLRAVTALVAIAAAGLAALGPTDITAIAVSGLSLAAAGLFPVCALGLSWKRVTGLAASAAIVTGAAVSLYYDIGTQALPAAFYKTWPALSDAGETAIEEFNLLDEAVRDAPDDASKAEARAALDDWARGTATRPGLANWGGLDAAASAAIAVPCGFLVLVLASLVARPRRRASDQP